MDDETEEEDTPIDGVVPDEANEGGNKAYVDLVDALGRTDEPEYLRAAIVAVLLENDNGVSTDKMVTFASGLERFIRTGETGVADLKVHNGPKKTVEQKA